VDVSDESVVGLGKLVATELAGPGDEFVNDGQVLRGEGLDGAAVLAVTQAIQRTQGLVVLVPDVSLEFLELLQGVDGPLGLAHVRAQPATTTSLSVLPERVVVVEVPELDVQLALTLPLLLHLTVGSVGASRRPQSLLTSVHAGLAVAVLQGRDVGPGLAQSTATSGR